MRKYWIIMGIENVEIDYLNFQYAGMKRSEVSVKTNGHVTSDLDEFFQYFSRNEVVRIEEITDEKYQNLKGFFDNLEENTKFVIDLIKSSNDLRAKINAEKSRIVDLMKKNMPDIVDTYVRYYKNRHDTRTWSMNPTNEAKKFKDAEIKLEEYFKNNKGDYYIIFNDLREILIGSFHYLM